jgi:hypothetical protein
VGSQFQVNTHTTWEQFRPAVSLDADGDFVVVWHSGTSPGNDSSMTSIQGQRYDTSGAAVGAQFQVNTHTAGYQSGPSVSLDADCDFVVAWWSKTSAGSDTWLSSVQGQHFDATGAAVGSQFQVNTSTAYDQFRPSVSLDADGDFVVAWTSYDTAGTDHNPFSIQGQRYVPEPGSHLSLLAGISTLALLTRLRRRLS